MKSASFSTRSRIAAASALLLSLGALVAAQPAQAQHAGVYVQTVPAPAYPAVVYEDDYRPGNRFGQHRFQRDHRAPVISDVTPNQGDRISERGRTRISARIHDGGSGIDERSVVLRVDGRDVSHRVRVDDDEVRYRDDLAPGRHYAELIVRDRAGNATRRTWWFDVVDEYRYGREYGWGYGYNR